MRTTVLKHDQPLKTALLKKLIADFQAGHLYHPLDKRQLKILTDYFQALNSGGSATLTLDKSIWSYEFEILVEVIADFLSDRPLEVLRKASYLHPWSLTSPALLEIVESSEFLVRSDPVPRMGPYKANSGASTVSFCVSYPRSGSTLLTNILDHVIPKSRHSVFWSDGRYFSRATRDAMTPGDAIVKDHLLFNDQLRNKILYVARDFRSVLRSQILFLFNSAKPHESSEIFLSLPLFLKYLEEDYKFGDWRSHVADALAAAQTCAAIKIVKYEDLTSGDSTRAVQDCLAFLDRPAERESVAAAREMSEEVGKSLRASHQVWRAPTALRDMPPLVQAAQNNAGPDWYRALPESDQNCVKVVLESPPSRALGYA